VQKLYSCPLLLTASVLIALTPGKAAADGALFERFTYDGTSQERVRPKSSQYRNPIIAGYYPDPSVTRVGETYYLVNSSFAHFPGLPVFKSRDLVNWTQIGNAIDRPDQFDFNGKALSQAIFAPDISWHNGTFYIVGTCVGCKGNFVMTAQDPAGPWSAPIWLPFEGIDPSIHWEGDRAYIVNNRAPKGPSRYEGHRAIWLQEFDWRAGKMVGESTQLVDGGVDITQKPVWIEGPHLVRKDGYYVLTAAEGGTGTDHSQVVFRSKTLRGPFVPYGENPILTQRDLPATRPNPISSAGHAKFVQTQKGDWWAVFLATRPYEGDRYITGRETFLLPVQWRDGWPHILGQGKVIPSVAQKPNLPAEAKPALPTSGNFSYVDEFKGDKLAMQWIGIRAPASAFHRVKNGMLELGSGAPLGDQNGVPAFLGRRMQHAVATISTTMRYAPGKDGARAGLAAVQSDRSWLFFGVTRIAGKSVVALFTRDKADADTLIASAPIMPESPVTLTIRVNGRAIGFDYTIKGKRRTLKKDLDAALLTTQQAGGFVGTVIGLYSHTPELPTN